MLRSRFLWKLYLTYAAVILISVGTIGFLVALQIAENTRKEIRIELQGKALFLRDLAAANLRAASAGDLNERIIRIGTKNRERLTVILANGKVLADSSRDPKTMDNHADRPEVLEALKLGTGFAERFSKTLNARMRYFALAVRDEDGNLIGTVRSAMSMKKIDERLAGLRTRVIWGAVVAVIMGLAIGFFFARRVTRPLVSMTTEARALAEGDPGRKVEVHSHDEVGSLAKAFNTMADTLRERMETITEDRNKVVAILRSMVEGVVAVDRDERIVQINSVASRLLQITERLGTGKRIWEVTRLQEVWSMVTRTLKTGQEISGEIRMGEGRTARTLVVHTSPLQASRTDTVGAVVLLRDVTEQRRLETMRRDFVANVSHELKTPLTAIRGLVETILDDPDMAPETRHRFLTMMDRQSARLAALLTDLLSLASIESHIDSVENNLDRKALDMREPATESFQQFAREAEERGLTLEKEMSDTPVPVLADDGALRQVVDNLVQNAIRYTPEGGKILVRVHQEGEYAVLTVQDSGIGIHSQHHDRLFERFYRVDTARSRELGGTGLGLAIVKHLTQAHGGEVTMESEPGRGSTFRVRLPIHEMPTGR